MFNRLKNCSIFYKIAFLYLIFMTAAITLTSVFFVRENLSLLKERESVVGETNLSIAADYYHKKYNMVYSLSNYIHSSEIAQIISKINEDPEQSRDYSNISTIQSFFKGVEATDEDVEDIILITDQNSVFSDTVEGLAEIRPSYPFTQSSFLGLLEQTEKDLYVLRDNPSDYTLKERKEDVLSFIGRIYNANLFPAREPVGYYIINFSIHALDERLLHEGWDGLGVLTVHNQQGELLFTTDRGYENSYEKEDAKSITDGKRAFEESAKVGTSGIEVKYSLSQDVFLKRWRMLILRMSGFIIGIGVLLLASGIWITRRFRKKIVLLQQGMQKVQEGILDVEVDPGQEDEIGQIITSFNEMCDKLNTYVNLVYQAEIARKDAQINALQAQINPHFLYNTLESIKAQAVQAGDGQTADMICLLGNLFRWSSNFSERVVYLEDELDYCRTYLELMNYRMNGSLELEIQALEEYMEYGIPKLILQPIIENTVVHGFADKSGKKIVGIVIKKKETNLELTIYDNGTGMTKEKLEKIRTALEDERQGQTGDGIGVRNVHSRLRLMFGEPYGLKIESIQDMGTAIKIVIPAMNKREMEEHV